MKRIGVMGSGGNAPGVGRCAIDAARYAKQHGIEVIGLRNAGTDLMHEKFDPDVMTRAIQQSYFSPIDRDYCHGFMSEYFLLLRPELEYHPVYERSGNFLGSCTDGIPNGEQLDNFRHNLEALELDALIVIGGDGSLEIVSNQIETMGLDIKLMIVGKTIDNDLDKTDFSLGMWSAVEHNAAELQRLMVTCSDHSSIQIMQVMGRDSPELLAHTVLNARDVYGAPYADMVLGLHLGEEAKVKSSVGLYNMETINEFLLTRYNRRAAISGLRHYTVIVVGECMTDIDGNSLETGQKSGDGAPIMGGTGKYLEYLLKTQLPKETRSLYSKIRVTELGHTQRGADVCDRDKTMAWNLAVKAVDSLRAGISHHVVTQLDGEFGLISIADHPGKKKVFDPYGYNVAMLKDLNISLGDEPKGYWLAKSKELTGRQEFVQPAPLNMLGSPAKGRRTDKLGLGATS
ncbi:MAG TPA: 6-phosphofructokinase [Alphaproteobacteria bacterium]|nr:hypothetical protein [Rhodospirillaceae bacterium]HRJ11998.1 6-phosphofructokinase [Alphaproteobacteria bacterium]